MPIRICRRNRDQPIAKIRSGLEQITATVQRGHRCSGRAQIERRVAKLFGNKSASRYFRWELLPLTLEEQAVLPLPGRGCHRATHRFVFHFDPAAAEAEAVYDGYSALVTTAPRTWSADELFRQFKQQNWLELLHHQWKTPLAVRCQAGGGPPRPAAACLDRVSVVGASVPSAGCCGCGRRGAADDQRIPVRGPADIHARMGVRHEVAPGEWSRN